VTGEEEVHMYVEFLLFQKRPASGKASMQKLGELISQPVNWPVNVLELDSDQAKLTCLFMTLLFFFSVSYLGFALWLGKNLHSKYPDRQLKIRIWILEPTGHMIAMQTQTKVIINESLHHIIRVTYDSIPTKS
jgi:hypothetical protein